MDSSATPGPNGSSVTQHQERGPSSRKPPPWDDPALFGNGARQDSSEPEVVSLRELARGGSRSIAGISARGFVLGISFTLGLMGGLDLLLVHSHPLWRPAFFLSTLSLFHFLEFYVTAAYNAPRANIAAYLLSSNGKSYQLAHLASFLECIITSIYFHGYQTRVSSTPVRSLGLIFVLAGQTVRSLAMATAGTNFNHFVQQKRAKGHELVTWGIYHWLRHPAYFGFFWWAIGTQMVLGNVLTGVLFIAVLWQFFRRRIPMEESFLVTFFGDDYKRYCSRTWIGIPFVPSSYLLDK